MKKQVTLVPLITLLALTVLAACAGNQGSASQGGTDRNETSMNRSATGQSRLEQVSYRIRYENQDYNKSATVYVPDGYEEGTPMEVLYLLHGYGGGSNSTAQDFQSLLDDWIAQGRVKPMLVVFPTYYPDESSIGSSYPQDYPLNHFFATDEVEPLLQAVETTFTTHAASTSSADLTASRTHRAFGGYSMGGITTWDVLAAHPEYFYYYMPMAGDSWIGRVTGDSSTQAVAATMVSGLEDKGYSADDFQIIAMVGGNDGTKSSMIPQIEALRRNQADLINDRNLLYWENAGGGHDQDSFEAEVAYGAARLFDR